MPFRLILALHTPVLLQTVPPRLDTLLHEATSRLTGRFSGEHDLPLTFDERLGGYRASQIVFATTPDIPLAAGMMPTTSRYDMLDRHLVTDPPRKIQQIGGGAVPRLTQYAGLSAPYLTFYGDGDGPRCAQLIRLLDGIGRGHTRGAGSFNLVSVESDETDRWRRRSWPAGTRTTLDFEPVHAHERLRADGETVAVVRPHRIQREVLT